MKIYSLGEVLVDFTPLTKEGQERPIYQQNPGGAPANVAVMAARLGAKCEMIGKVGEDLFGDFLIKELASQGVGTDFLSQTSEAMTSLAFVKIDSTGEREFAFYRSPGADSLLEKKDTEEVPFDAESILHFGTISLLEEPSRGATLASIERATAAQSIISFDPNIRLNLWPSEESVKERILEVLPFVDILKVSEQELAMLAPELEMQQACHGLVERFGLSILLVTQGDKGASYYQAGKVTTIEGFATTVVDTTGAGDAFWGTVLAGLSTAIQGKLDLKEVHLSRIVRLANAAGSLTVEKLGGIPALPTDDEIHEVVKDN